MLAWREEGMLAKPGKPGMRALTTVGFVLAIVAIVVVVMVSAGLYLNRVPLFDTPGPGVRLGVYLRTNVAQTSSTRGAAGTVADRDHRQSAIGTARGDECGAGTRLE